MGAHCQTCGKWFIHAVAAMQHMTAVDHWQEYFDCETCDARCMYKHDQTNHMNAQQHWAPRFRCNACDSLFLSQPAARQHMDQANHWRRHWCEPCRRGFQNENNLQQHLKGSAHRANSINCPFCKKSHTTASGVVHHVESGSCPSAKTLDREKIYQIINKADTQGAITNKQLTWHSQQNGEQIATSATWNGRHYECYICHRAFNTLPSLNQHLSSPVHKQQLYHCFGPNCGKKFTALAQLFNHLESESCKAMRFDAVQKNASDILTGQRRIAF